MDLIDSNRKKIAISWAFIISVLEKYIFHEVLSNSIHASNVAVECDFAKHSKGGRKEMITIL